MSGKLFAPSEEKSNAIKKIWETRPHVWDHCLGEYFVDEHVVAGESSMGQVFDAKAVIRVVSILGLKSGKATPEIHLGGGCNNWSF